MALFLNKMIYKYLKDETLIKLVTKSHQIAPFFQIYSGEHAIYLLKYGGSKSV